MRTIPPPLVLWEKNWEINLGFSVGGHLKEVSRIMRATFSQTVCSFWGCCGKVCEYNLCMQVKEDKREMKYIKFMWHVSEYL